VSVAVLKAVRVRQRVLEGTVKHWLTAVQSDHNLRGALILPLRDVAGSIVDLSSISKEFPDVLSRVEGKDTQAAVRDRLAAIGGELTASHGPLRDSLSSLATEAATGRTLIVNGDLFDVSSFGVLIMSGLSNLLHLAFGKKPRSKREKATEPNPAPIEGLLDVAKSRTSLRPGDLWLADIAARTALAVWEEAGSGERKRPVWLQKMLPRFIALSSLFKLTGITKFGSALAKKADYKLWPGLDVLIGEPGARPARAILVGELANALCGSGAGLAQVALFRFLSALAEVEPIGLAAIFSKNLAATLFWEVLELDPKALGRMVDLGPPAAALLDMIEATDALSRETAPEGYEPEHARLAETGICLRTFPEFNALLALRRGLVANRSIL